MIINAEGLDHKALNQQIQIAEDNITITNCCGQRFIASGMKDKHIRIEGTPGNALAAYLDGGVIEVNGNAQDAVGDTMNEGTVIIHGNIGDAAGYAMRGGRIYIEKDAGYRAGIHMKAYESKIPVMIIGGKAGSFLGEYQAGGVIIVLGLSNSKHKTIGAFPCTGMHGGKMYIRGNCNQITFPSNVCVRNVDPLEKEILKKELLGYCEVFNFDIEKIMDSDFTLITPDSKNPYTQMYIAN